MAPRPDENGGPPPTFAGLAHSGDRLASRAPFVDEECALLAKMPRPTLSLVLPVYNEEDVIPILHDRLQDFLAEVAVDTEVIFVNDGSTDRSLVLLRELVQNDSRYKAISFSRNFGHGNAITAGVDYARGHAVAIMDADLQDPPEVIVKMLQRWREGYDVVYGQRLKREGETAFKLLTSKWFYRLLRALVPINVPLDTGDFRLMSRQVVVTLRALRETHRFIRGIVSWVGFRQTAVFYDRPSRVAGETKYPLSKMLRLALDAITSFSVLPLRFSTYLGATISLASVLTAGWAVFQHYVFKSTVPGWTATVVLVSLLSSVQLLMIGILGEYIGRIYEQVKGRPLYLVAETINLPREVDTDEIEEGDAASLLLAPARAPSFLESYPMLAAESVADTTALPARAPSHRAGAPHNPMKQRVYEANSAPPVVPPLGPHASTKGQPNPMKGTLIGVLAGKEDATDQPLGRMKETLMGVSPSPTTEQDAGSGANTPPPPSQSGRRARGRS
jgi:dolichol-phosphate mannosyltransferase